MLKKILKTITGVFVIYVISDIIASNHIYNHCLQYHYNEPDDYFDNLEDDRSRKKNE